MTDTINVLSPDSRNIIIKELPFMTGAWVKFYDDMTYGQAVKVQGMAKADFTNLESQSSLLLSQIADWNFGDETNTKIPISVEGLNRLSTKIVAWLYEQLTAVLTIGDSEGKKNIERSDSNPTS